MDTPKKAADGRFSLLKKIVKYLTPLVITVVLLLWLFHKVDMHTLRQALHEHIKFGYIIAMMVLTVLSHIIRGIRWGYQLRAVGIPRIPAVAESCSIFGAYALNLVFPFLGEAWRCLYISRRNNAKLATVVGTDAGDRISDLIVIILLTMVTLVVARRQMIHFFDTSLRSFSPDSILSGSTIWIAAIVVVALIVAALVIRHSASLRQKVTVSVKRIIAGFMVLFHMKGLGAYLLLTIGIWVCYFLQTYLCLFAFPYTAQLIDDPGTFYGIIPGLVVFMFGSFSMAVPSNGGLGPWNIAVMLGLTLYGVSTADATAWSLVYWGWQSLAQIAAGIFAAIYISREHR